MSWKIIPIVGKQTVYTSNVYIEEIARQINKAIQQLDLVIQRNAATEEIAATAQELDSQA